MRWVEDDRATVAEGQLRAARPDASGDAGAASTAITAAGATRACAVVTTDLCGRTLDQRYQVVAKIGSGSMGDVFEGYHIASGRHVAIKVLKRERAIRDVFRQRFLREARSSVMIAHPNVVEVLDYGESPEGHLYFTMEFLQGEDLRAIVRRDGAMSWPRCQEILRQVAGALAAAHACGIIHRDVKPANILQISEPKDNKRIKLADFGVAKLSDTQVSQALTHVDDVVGTVLYMSPEQAEGEAVDERSDIYALGVTAFELATGALPFPGTDVYKVMAAHLQQPAPKPSSRAPLLPRCADQFILRCLEKRPADRYSSMQAVLDALRNDDAVADSFDDDAPTAYFRRARASVPTTQPAPTRTVPAPTRTQPMPAHVPPAPLSPAGTTVRVAAAAVPPLQWAPAPASVAPYEPAPAVPRTSSSLLAVVILLLAAGVTAVIVIG